MRAHEVLEYVVMKSQPDEDTSSWALFEVVCDGDLGNWTSVAWCFRCKVLICSLINAAWYDLELEAQPIRNGGVAKEARSKTYCSPTDRYELLHTGVHNQSTAGVIAITLIIPQRK